jgi:phosphoribosylanthranilate isomerase
VHPFAVDVNSGVEWTPGMKNAEKVHAFMAQVRLADQDKALDG